MSSVDGLRADIVWEANTGQAIAELGAVGDEYARTTGAMSDQALRLAAAQDRLTASIRRSGPESRAAKTATLAYREELAAVAQQANATSTAISRQAEAQARASKIATDAALKNQLAAARSVGHTLTTYVTVPTALVGAAAVKMAFDFEAATRLIQTQAGATAGEVELVRKGILDLVKSGDSFGQTADDMAKGLFFIESEGIRGAKALDILKVAAAGAAVGQTDLGQTANALTSVMRVYGLDANQAAGAMATLNAAVGAGKLHMEDLNSALATKFLPTAKQLGITLPQALAALDVFTKTGPHADATATSLTTSFIKMLSPTKAAAASLQLLGLSSTQLGDDLQRGGLPAALADLVKGYDKLEGAQNKAAASRAVFGAFGGSKGGAPVLTLIQQYKSYLQGLDQVQRQANPATFWNQVAATMHEPSQKVKEDIARITGSLVDLGNKLAPLVADVSGDVDKIAGAFAKLPGPIKAELGAIILLLAVGGPVLKAIVGTTKAVRLIGGAFKTIPAQAGPPIAATEAELATLRRAGVTTATSLEASGAAGGAGLARGVAVGAGEAEASVATAEASVLALRASLLGLGALAIAPIVIPIAIKYLHVGSAPFAISGAFGHATDEVKAQILAAYKAGKLSRQDIEKYAEAGLLPKSALRRERRQTEKQAADREAKSREQQAADRAGPARPPKRDGGGDRRRGPSLTQIQLHVSAAELAIARGDKGAQEQLTRALEEEIAYDRQQEKRQEDLLRRHIGDRQKHIQALEALRADEASALDQIKSGKSARTSARGSARAAADSQKEAGLDAQISRAQSAEKSARTVRQEQAAYERERNARKLLLALYEREAHDKTLTRSQRASAERKAAAERKTLAGLEDKSREDELAYAVLQAKNAVAAATVGSKAYEQAQAAERKALNAQIAYERSRERNAHLSVEARKRALEKELAARHQLAALDKQAAKSSASGNKNEALFLSEAARILGFAPNATPIAPPKGKSETHLYESVHELRQIKHHLSRIRSTGQFPGTADAEAASLAVTG